MKIEQSSAVIPPVALPSSPVKVVPLVLQTKTHKLTLPKFKGDVKN